MAGRSSRAPRLKDTDSLDSLNVGSMRQLMREEVIPILKPSLDAFNKANKQTLKEIRKLNKTVSKMEKKVESLSSLKEHVEKQSEYTNSRIRDIYETVIPQINTHMASIGTALTKRMLDLDVHRRKWSLTIQGVAGAAGEDERITRSKVVDFAINKLRIRNAATTDYAACHRLSQEANSGIIMRFIDLSQRNSWLDAAKNLKHFPDCNNVSISPDLPNDLRPLKTELLNKRKALPSEQKKNSSIRFLKEWPYVELRVKNHPTIRPTESVAHVCERVLGLTKDSLLLTIPEPERDPPESLSDGEEVEEDEDDDEAVEDSGDESTLEGDEEDDDDTQY